MHSITLFILAAVFAIILAESHYVPGAYYTIDAEGHESERVPCRRIRRSDANANTDAEACIQDNYSGIENLD